MKRTFVTRLIVLAAAVGLVAALAAACGGDDSDGGIQFKGTNTAGGGSETKTGGGDAKQGGDSSGGASEVAMVFTDNVFAPKDFTVPVGKTVTISIKNNGSAIHNLHVLSKDTEGKDFNSKAQISGGEEDKMQVTFKKKGIVKFQCDYHVPDMVGTITVK